MDARRAAQSDSTAICKLAAKADAGRQANPKGKLNAGRIAALRLACVAELHGAPRALHCIPAFIFRTPVLVETRPWSVAPGASIKADEAMRVVDSDERACSPELLCASSYKKHSGFDAGHRQQQRAEQVQQAVPMAMA